MDRSWAWLLMVLTVLMRAATTVTAQEAEPNDANEKPRERRRDQRQLERDVFDHFETLTAGDGADDVEVLRYLNVTHESSSVSSIDLSWIVLDLSPVHSIKLRWRREDSGPITSSDVIPTTTEHYEIKDLISNSKYDICFEMVVVLDRSTDMQAFTESNQQQRLETRLQCAVYSTIPLVRYQDVLVLLCVVGYLLVMCLIGLVCWTKAKRRYKERLMNDDDDVADDLEVGVSTTASCADQSPVFSQHTPQIYPANQKSANNHSDIPYIDDDRRETKHLL